MVIILFWLSAFLIIYPYIIYPAILWFLMKVRPISVHKTSIENWPSVSIVMAVKNEESNLRRKLNNLLELDYPKDKLEIIVISDGSTDNTNQILEDFISKSSRLSTGSGPVIKKVIYSPSKGKAYALNQGVREAAGDIILFADCRQKFDPMVAKRLVENFSDPQVGCVSGELCFLEALDSDIQVEMNAYWRFEKWIRKMESATGAVVGATGAIYAIRRKLYKALPAETILDDVLTPMNTITQGYRVIFEPKAIAYDIISKDLTQEKRRKLRTLVGNWQFINIAPELFNPSKNPIWWRFISHKMCRLIVPFALLLLLISCVLGQASFYQCAFLLQVFFYSVALAGLLFPPLREISIVNLACFFLSMNTITGSSLIVWLSGKVKYAWK